MFVTGWQSKAQISHRYGTLADAVLGGHRSKVIFNGTDDPSTLDYLSRVAGTEHVAQRGWSADTGGGRKTVSEHVQREDLLPAHVIRQMRRQEAVLLHGTLPPIHLRLVRWWEDQRPRRARPDRRRRQAVAAAGGPGRARSGPGRRTRREPGARPDRRRRVGRPTSPRPRRPHATDRPAGSGATRHPGGAGQAQLDFAAAADQLDLDADSWTSAVDRESGGGDVRAVRRPAPGRRRDRRRVRRPEVSAATRPARTHPRRLTPAGCRSPGPASAIGSNSGSDLREQLRELRFVTVAGYGTSIRSGSSFEHLRRHGRPPRPVGGHRRSPAPAAWEDALVGAQSWLDYSARNQVLLASYGADGPVAGPETWRLVPSTTEDRGCAVRAGEHGYPVRVPVTTGGTEPDPYLGGSPPDPGRGRAVGVAAGVLHRPARPPTRTRRPRPRPTSRPR